MIRPVTWDAQAERGLLQAAGDPAVLAEARAAVEQGRATLWRVFGWVRVTHIVTRVERLADGRRELVIWLGEGTGTRRVIRWAVELATANGIDSLRAHVSDHRLANVFERLGWRESERVMTYGR